MIFGRLAVIISNQYVASYCFEENCTACDRYLEFESAVLFEVIDTLCVICMIICLSYNALFNLHN